MECLVLRLMRADKPTKIQRLTSFGAFYSISVSGFCDAESTSDPSTGDYYWPEALAGTISSQPCDGERVEGTASRECNSTRNWLEVDASACSLACAAELTETNTGNYSWPIVAAGVEYSQFCGLQSDVNATRQCDSTGSWLVVEDSLCLMITSQQYNELEDLIESGNVTEDNYDDLLVILVVLVDGTGSMDQTEDNFMTTIAFLVATAAIVHNPLVIVDMPDEDLNNTLMILDTIEDWDGDTFPDENTSQIVMAYETIIESIAQQENFTNFTFSGEDIFVIAIRLNTTTLAETGYGFSSQVNNGTLSAETAAPSSSNGDLETGEIATAFLPGSLLSAAGEDVAVVFAVYEQSTLLPVTQQPEGLLNTIVGTAVVAAAIAGMTFDNLTDPVVLVFLLNTEGATNIRCVSYDFGLSAWSTEGCDTEVNGTTVTCSCNHLTNFGALVDVCSRTDGCETNEDETLALEVISIIGVVLSLVGIVSTIITLLVFKKLRKRDATKFHIQLCIAIGCMLIVFLTGIDQTDPSGGCVAVSALIHYFTLASVLWMGAEAVLMFQKLAIVFVQISNRYIICVSLVCWLASLVPVVIPLAIDPDFMVTYVDGSDTDIDFCFTGETGVFFGAFLGPIIAVILFNIVIFFIVVFVLVRHTMGTMSRRNEKLNMPTALRLIISISGVMFLFGLTWLFGAFTISDASFTFQLLFTIFNSLQGFFIFLFFCVLSKDAREAWLGVLLCRSKPRESTKQGKFTSGGVHANKTATGSTGFSSTTHISSKPAPTHSEYEMPEVKTYPSELEKTDTSTFKREIAQSEGTDTGATKVEITPGEVKQENEYDLGIPIKTRVERHSTKRVGKHHIETYEVDFEDNSAEDEEDEAAWCTQYPVLTSQL